jgi:3-phosphoshikimate 1-carboxyvinyltransferase
MRFLAAFVAAANGTYRLDGTLRMRERPIGDLLRALQMLNASARAENGDGRPPVVVEANGLRGGRVSVRGDVSSQFLSALLLVAPLAREPMRIEVLGTLVSKPYVDMTLATMADFGVEVAREAYDAFRIEPATYRAREYAVEPDASAASYFFAAAAITGGRATIPGLGSKSLQGDLEFVRVLERMGCTVEQTASATTVIGGPLRGVDVDMCHISDTVPTLSAVACFAEGPTTLRNVAHVRVKECDRLSAVATELGKAGVRVEERQDGLTIHPQPLRGATFATYDDHRMAMSLALLGLKTPGVAISNPECTAKTYPNFFRDLAAVTFP